MLEKRAGCFLFRGGEVGEASVEYDVGDRTEFGEVKVVGVVGIADGGLAWLVEVVARGVDVFIYNGAAAGFFCNTEGFFPGAGGILLVDVEIRPVAALLSLGGGDSSKVDDLCRFRSRADAAVSFAEAPEARCAAEYKRAEDVLLLNSLRDSLDGAWWSWWWGDSRLTEGGMLGPVCATSNCSAKKLYGRSRERYFSK